MIRHLAGSAPGGPQEYLSLRSGAGSRNPGPRCWIGDNSGYSLAAPPVSQLVAKHGLADLLVARHVLEHAHDPVSLLASLGKLTAPGGYFLLEVPDCTKFVRACDYSFVWEEHVTYFSAETLTALIDRAALTLHEIFVHRYPYEDALIAIQHQLAAPGERRKRHSWSIGSGFKFC